MDMVRMDVHEFMCANSAHIVLHAPASTGVRGRCRCERLQWGAGQTHSYVLYVLSVRFETYYRFKRPEQITGRREASNRAPLRPSG